MEIFEWLLEYTATKTMDALSTKFAKTKISQSNEQHLNTLRKQLNYYFNNEVEIFCFNSNEPLIHTKGEYEISPTQSHIAEEHKIELIKKRRPNDPHAIVTNTPIWQSDPANIEIQILDYSTVYALRQDNIKPQILSANGVVICPETEELILHRRGDVATYPHKLHTLGGAYIPDGYNSTCADRAGLSSTATREIHEETQLQASTYNTSKMLIAKELSTGFIQLAFLGIPICAKSINKATGNWEGQIERIKFSKLEHILKEKDWVPSGKAHILAWLGQGAPNTKKGQKFGNLSAKDLFNSIVEP